MEESRSTRPAAGERPVAMPGGQAADRLRRELGLVDAVGVGLGAIIGAGIFVVTGVAAGVAGPAFLIGLLIAAAVAACNALSSAQLAAAFPRSGGAYEYGYRVLTPTAGFAAGCMFLASKTAAAGTVALGLAGYLEALLPGVGARPLAVGAILLFTLLNYLGIRRSSTANLLIVLVSVGSLLLFVAAAAPAIDAANFRPFNPAGWRGILESAAILFFAYTGYARVATLAEEVREPRRTIPRAIVMTLGIAVVLYVVVSLAALGVAGAARMGESTAPLHAAAALLGPPWVAPTIALGGVVAMLGVILSQLLGLSRVVFAMAGRGDLPRLFGAVHPRFGVPGRAVLAAGAIAALVAATGSLRESAALASFTILVYYFIANLAAIRMPKADKLVPDAVPVVGALTCVLLALSLGAVSILTGSAILAAALLGRALLRRD